jgi:hypothetical protein
MLEKSKARAGIIGELFKFLKKRKLWWLMPMIVMLLIVGVLLILATVSSTFAPFIYTLF